MADGRGGGGGGAWNALMLGLAGLFAVLGCMCGGKRQHQDEGGVEVGGRGRGHGTQPPGGRRSRGQPRTSGGRGRPERGEEEDHYTSTTDQDGHFPEEFLRQRREADTAADARGDCFERSRAAYAAGRKGEAKELSNQGKAYGRKMDLANKAAVRALLQPQHCTTRGVIDLHGLTVKESEEEVNKFLDEMMRQKQLGTRRDEPTVEIITGRGIHSRNHQAKVRPAIASLLRKRGIEFHHPPHNEGAFEVVL